MAKSELRTKVAVLRSVLGLSAKEFAQMTGRSFHTQKALESGRLKLSDRLAARISACTSVGMHWLLDDDVTGPPVDRVGDPLTRESYEKYAAALARGEKTTDELRDFPKIMADALKGILEKAEDLPGFELDVYIVARFLIDLERDILPEEQRTFKGMEQFFASPKKPKASGSSKRRA